MYCHELKCQSGNTKFLCQSEDSAQQENVIMFWLDDVPLNENQILSFSKELEAWAKEQGFKFGDSEDRLQWLNGKSLSSGFSQATDNI